MARTARVVVPELSLHVVHRGHDRRDCFFQESDYRAYLNDLETFAGRFGCSIHPYCLMTNHVHLLMTPHTADACALCMKNTAQCHVQRINKRLRRTGTLWEGRFYSCPVPSERYALTCYRYVERNPVEARMVEHPRQYRWSSYQTNAEGLPAFIVPHPAYEALATETSLRAKAYAALCDVPLDPKVVDEIRKATRRGYAIGTARKPRGRPRPPVMRKMGSVPT
jgi:putative transposase